MRISDWSSTCALPILAERLRLRDLRCLGDADGQVALGDGDGADPHVLAHDDNAGSFVDDDLRDLVGRDAELLDPREQGDAVAAVLRRPGQLPGTGVERLRDELGRASGRERVCKYV